MESEARSELSLGFQQHWSGLLKEGEIIPTLTPEDMLEMSGLLPMLGIVELDIENQSLEVVYAGSEIGRYLGFEMMGSNLVELNLFKNAEASWERRRHYFSQPCGFFEVVAGAIEGFGESVFAITLLPIFGEQAQTRLMIYVEAKERLLEVSNPSDVVGRVIARFPIDLGYGVPNECAT